MRNTGDPTCQPSQAKTVVIRERPKCDGDKRESEGLVVPAKAATTRWREGALLSTKLEEEVSARA
jgi:hypothetical protein